VVDAGVRTGVGPLGEGVDGVGSLAAFVEADEALDLCLAFEEAADGSQLAVLPVEIFDFLCYRLIRFVDSEVLLRLFYRYFYVIVRT